jgi:hypothetical protein
MKWEFIKTIEHGVLRNREIFKRLKVPGGWLVKYMDVSGPRSPIRHDIIYVPDCGEPWDINENQGKLEKLVHKRNPNYGERTYRLKVPGGWVVLDGQYGAELSHISLAFVPDPKRQWKIKEKDNNELNSKQPLLQCTGHLSTYTSTDTSRIKLMSINELVAISGIVTKIREIGTKSAGMMACVTIEDLQGTIEVIFFPDTYKSFYDLVHGEGPVIIKGIIEHVDETIKITCREVQALAAKCNEENL